MSESREGGSASAGTSSKAKKADTGDVAKAREQAIEQGYFGERPDGPAVEEYALPSGPDSPSAAEAILASKQAEVAAIEESLTEGKG